MRAAVVVLPPLGKKAIDHTGNATTCAVDEVHVPWLHKAVRIVVHLRDSFSRCAVEASMRRNLNDGDTVSAVVGRIRSSVEHIEETLRTLHVLTSLFGVRNGPLLPDNQTSDEIRWRGIVAALASDHQAERELQTVENIREC